MPCDDCHGIYTLLVLDANGKYRLERKYLGKSDAIEIQQGSYTFTDSNKLIVLSLRNKETLYFEFRDDVLNVLDQQQNKMKLKNNDDLLMIPVALTNSTFWLKEINQQKGPLDLTQSIWLTFDKETLLGFTSCNNLRGHIQHEPDQKLLTISSIATSKKFCHDNKIESTLLSTLQDIAKYTLNEDSLILMNLHDKPLLVFKAGAPR
jgi:heat shock protein HslJ